jgi:hypothetical protein
MSISDAERERILDQRNTFRTSTQVIYDQLNKMSRSSAEAGLPGHSRQVDAMMTLLDGFRASALKEFDRKAQVLRGTIGKGEPAGG